MSKPYSITGIFSRLTEITKKKFKLATSSETISNATKKVSTPDTESAIRHIRNESDEVELRLVKDMELYAKNVGSIREEVMGVRLKKGDPGDLTEHEKEFKVACRALIRAKRDFDASIDTGEIYQIFMRLFSYLTLKQRHLLYPVLCKHGSVVGIDDSTLSSISEVISNDDFCLKYKEIYDIFYSVK